MSKTTNYELEKYDDNMNCDFRFINGSLDKIDEELKKNSEQHEIFKKNINNIENNITHITENLSIEKSGEPSDGIYPTVTWKNQNGAIVKKSMLSGGNAPKWIYRDVLFYENGTKIKSIRYKLLYDEEDNVISEVLI